jgi:hypothetical protein
MTINIDRARHLYESALQFKSKATKYGSQSVLMDNADLLLREVHQAYLDAIEGNV